MQKASETSCNTDALKSGDPVPYSVLVSISAARPIIVLDENYSQ